MNKKKGSSKCTWKKPELIILTHSNEDEVLTLGCKLVDIGSIGPTTNNNKCDKPGSNSVCQACQAQNSKS